ncbi:MAG: nucleotidyltransferase domain-containing protein [Microthrixaceae bacterium]
MDELVEGIRNEIDAWPDPGLVPDAVALFGSAATGRMRPTSDIDLFVLQPDELLDTIGEGAELRQESWDHQLEWLRRVIGRWTGNDVRILDLSWHDLGRGMDSELRPVVRDIAEHGIWVIGSADLLRSNVDAR